MQVSSHQASKRNDSTVKAFIAELSSTVQNDE